MKISLGEKIFNKVNLVILFLITFLTFYPFYYVVMASFSDGNSLMAHNGPLLMPLNFNLDAYAAVFKNPAIYVGYMNTIFIVVFGVIVSLLMTSLGAYFLSRRNVFWKKPIMMMIVFTMFFSGGLIPFYLTVKGLHLDNTLWSVIIPFAIDTFNLIIMRTAFMSVPYSLEESAKIDGANDFTVLFRIIIPMSIPIMMVMMLYYGVSKWNGWFYLMLFVRKADLYPLQLILREILIQNRNEMLGAQDQYQLAESIKYATIMVATIPILLVYPFMQKHFVKGAMIGSVKE